MHSYSLNDLLHNVSLLKQYPRYRSLILVRDDSQLPAHELLSYSTDSTANVRSPVTV
jgi:hypothetical protein